MKTKYVVLFIYASALLIGGLLLNNKTMKFSPNKNVTYKTALAKAEVQERLTAATEPVKKARLYFFGKPKHVKDFQGIVNEDSFSIKRIIAYNNPFLPEIVGSIQGQNQGTAIQVKYKLQRALNSIFLLWGICFLFAFLFALLYSFLLKDKFDPKPLLTFIPICLFMLVFAYGFVTLGFTHEYKKANKSLQELFEADAIEEN